MYSLMLWLCGIVSMREMGYEARKEIDPTHVAYRSIYSVNELKLSMLIIFPAKTFGTFVKMFGIK